MSLVSAFTQAVLPIIAIMGLGYVLAIAVDVDADPLNAVALYAFLPALIFHTLTTTSLGGEAMLRIFGGVVAFVVVMGVVAEVLARLFGVVEPFRSATVLASSFPNAGFYGIPLAEFAFGRVGRTTAALFVVAQAFLMYTAGVYVASRGGGNAGYGAVEEIFKLPLVYAIAAALLVRALGVVPPEGGTFMSTVQLVGNASIPLMLVIVGIQLEAVDEPLSAQLVTPTVLKLGVAPLVGAAVALLVAFESVAVARVFVLLCATPVALIPLALTISYSDDPERDGVSASAYLTSVILVTTLVSVPVLTGLIVLLQSGVFP